MKMLNKNYNDVRLEFTMKRLGKKIKKLREEKGMTQMSLAFQIDSSQSIINSIENKTDYNPTLFTLAKIAYVFNITVSDLLSNTRL